MYKVDLVIIARPGNSWNTNLFFRRMMVWTAWRYAEYDGKVEIMDPSTKHSGIPNVKDATHGTALHLLVRCPGREFNRMVLEQ